MDRKFVGLLIIGFVGLVSMTAVVWVLIESGIFGNIGVRSPEASNSDSEKVVATETRRRATDAELEQARRAASPDGLLSLAIRRYRVCVGKYPDNLAQLVKKPEFLPEGKSWGGPYLSNEKLLVDPWGREYQYRTPGVFNETSFDLWTDGADGEHDTFDDVYNW